MRTSFPGLLMVASVLGNYPATIVSATECMTVEQTLYSTKGVFIDAGPEQVHSHLRLANPLARDGLYRILDDPKQSGRWAKTAGLLAYISRPDDIARLREFMFSQKGLLSEERYDAICSVVFVLSVMAVRGIGEARDEVWKMVRPAYWRNAQFSLQRSWRGERGPVPIELAGSALVIYVKQERGNDAERLIEEVSNMPGSDEQRNGLAQFVEEARQYLDNPPETMKAALKRFGKEVEVSKEADRTLKSTCSRWFLAGFGVGIGAALVLWLVLRVVQARWAKASALAGSAPAGPVEAADKRP